MGELFTEDDEQFRSQWGKHQEELQGIVALKGLPFTWKTRLAKLISEWAMSPVFCIDDFLGYETFRSAAYQFTPPGVSRDEAEIDRHNEHAITTLCTVAKRHLDPKFSGRVFGTVVTKSRLVTEFELYKLVDLAHIIQLRKDRMFPLLIIECQMRSEFMWENRLKFFSGRKGDWYRPMNWKEIEKVRDDYAAQLEDWNDHLRHLIDTLDNPPPIRWLVVDPHIDLSITSQVKVVGDLTAVGFFDAVKYLLQSDQIELKNQNPYVVEFDELRRFLFDRKLSSMASKERSQNLCTKSDCLFKYQEAIEAEACGICEERVSGPAYTCYFCTLTLHKSCAETVDFNVNHSSYANDTILEFFYYYKTKFPEKHACSSCIEEEEGFSEECRACLFQTHLECRMVPTIIKTKSHDHFLSIQFHKRGFFCKACQQNYSTYSYGCRRCAVYYHLDCAFLFGELKHEHGGYEHVMKLMYSRDGIEPEESYWCDHCYVDMDPQGWFYCCQECPYYTVHPNCTTGYDKTYQEVMSLVRR
ncbi:hypothetical protein V2J09_005320 [Rumex salicifolius]